MAEFDDSAFDAVDSFLRAPKDQENEEEEAPSKTVSEKTPPASNRRLGVGAVKTPVETSETNVVISRRILQVGKKPKLDDDQEEEDQPLISIEEDDDGEEEEVGRTAIEKQTTSTLMPSAAVLARAAGVGPKTRKKRKKGKKERQKQKAEEDKSDDLNGEDKHQTITSKQGSTDSADDNEFKSATQMIKKRKRPKIRSRQKNIYKDHRDKKPDYLIPGKRNYQGRPLTPATRIKLNLPPSKTSLKQTEHLDSHWDEEPNDSIDAKPLAVDAYKDPGTPEMYRKRKKKSKYKNLKV